MEPVQVNVNYSVEDFVRALVFVRSRKWIYRNLWLVAGCAAFAFGFFYFYLRSQSDDLDLLFATVATLAIGSVVAGVMYITTRFVDPLILHSSVRKQMSKSPILQEPHVTQFSDIGVSGTTFLGDATTKWAAFVDVIETPTDFHFFTTPSFTLFVPKSSFATADDIERVRALILERFGSKASLL